MSTIMYLTTLANNNNKTNKKYEQIVIILIKDLEDIKLNSKIPIRHYFVSRPPFDRKAVTLHGGRH